MSAALRLVDLAMSMAATMHPAPLSTHRPSFFPTHRPSSRHTLLPESGASRMTQAPSTQRCATVHPRAALAARHEAQTLLALLRKNLAFLESLACGNDTLLALRALDDIHASVDRLEDCLVGSASTLVSRP